MFIYDVDHKLRSVKTGVLGTRIDLRDTEESLDHEFPIQPFSLHNPQCSRSKVITLDVFSELGRPGDNTSL